MDSERSLDRSDYKDLRRNFPLLKELFEYAEHEGFDATSFSDYSNEDGKENSRAIQLPENFMPLVAEHPGAYYIVAYANRQDAYYQQGTRSRMVRLSTVRKRAQSNERVREIDLEEVDPSKGSKVQIKVRESVNNESFATINTATGQEVEQPHGQADYTYELDTQGNKTITNTRFNRLDESLFPWNGEDKPVRWLRNLEVSKNNNNTSTLMYEDLYMIGRMENGKRDERCQVRTYITGSLEKPQEIIIEIGIGAPTSAKILYEDKTKNIKVLLHEGINAFKNQLQVVEQDPTYAALLKKPIDINELMKDITSKARMLQEDWDKPQAVFQKNPGIEAAKKQIT